VTALDRELLGFLWAIAVQREAQLKPQGLTGSLNIRTSVSTRTEFAAGWCSDWSQ